MQQMKDGYTRVSEIIGQWNHLAHIDPQILANKCRIGSEVHEKIAAETEGIFIDTEEDTKGYLQSWNKWKEEHEKKGCYFEIEKRLYCDHLKITGCVDALVKTGDMLTVIDYKTSASANKKMWALQASFYHYLAVQNHYDVTDVVEFIHLKKDGSMAKTVVIHCTEELWLTAKAALLTYRYFKG